MATLDRYIFGIYLKVLVVSFLSLAGLYIVMDGVGNAQELASYSKQRTGGVLLLMFEYYGPRLLWFFDFAAGSLATVAAVLTVSWLQRTNEYTAIVAAGIRPGRVIRTVVIATLAMAGLAAANREFWLPRVRGRLAYNAQDLEGNRGRPCTPTFDPQSDILLSAKGVFPLQQRLDTPSFRLTASPWGRQITADSAFYRPAAEGRPAGYLFRGVKQPANLGQLASISAQGAPALLSPSDTPGLAPDECFVVSVVTFEQLALGSGYRQFLSTPELLRGLHLRTLHSGADVLMTLHKRFVQPLLDVTIVFLALPLVLLRGSRTMIWAGMASSALTTALFLSILACQGLGMNYLLRPTLAIWLPLLVFAPISFSLSRPIWD